MEKLKQKKKKGRTAQAPTLTRIEKLTQGLMLPPDEVRANFTIRTDEEKGRGVFLKIPELPKGDFVLEYEGDIITPAEVETRERIYAANGEGCFIMEFMFRGQKMAIDATRRFDSYSRLVNHSRHPNIKFYPPFVIDVHDGQPRIAAYALRTIKKGEEIVFDYGVKDQSIPWLNNCEAGHAEVSDDDKEDDEDEESDSDSKDGQFLLRCTAAREADLRTRKHQTVKFITGFGSGYLQMSREIQWETERQEENKENQIK